MGNHVEKIENQNTKRKRNNNSCLRPKLPSWPTTPSLFRPPRDLVKHACPALLPLLCWPHELANSRATGVIDRWPRLSGLSPSPVCCSTGHGTRPPLPDRPADHLGLCCRAIKAWGHYPLAINRPRESTNPRAEEHLVRDGDKQGRSGRRMSPSSYLGHVSVLLPHIRCEDSWVHEGRIRGHLERGDPLETR